jgi:imidazolonepropionase-like amidohydrolase
MQFFRNSPGFCCRIASVLQKSILSAVAAAIMILPPELPAQPPPESTATIFEGARVIYDARRAPIEDGALVVDNGRIVAVGKRGSIRAPEGAEHVDLTGKTVMPALIDAHIHIGYQKGLVYSADNYTRENLTDQLHRYEYVGVSAVMSLGTDPGDIPLQLRSEQERDGGVLFRWAGRGLAAPNAGPNDPALKPSAYGVTMEEEARAAVRTEIARHVDFIKIWVDDRNGTVKKLSPALYRAIIDEAHRHGTRVIAHVFYLDDAKDLVRAGVDGFAHLVRDKELDNEAVALIRERKVLIMPNLGLAESRTYAEAPAWLDDPLLKEVAPAAEIARVRASYGARSAQAVKAAQETYRIMQKNLTMLNAAGAVIGFGTDAGAVPDYFYAYTAHHELQLMIRAGMTAAQALTAATVTNASFLRMPDHGTLERSHSADFIVLDGNPLDDVANTQKIARVYLRGREVDRAALRSAF